MSEGFIPDFFSDDSPLYQVITLHSSTLAWEKIHEMAPLLPRGWYELSKFSPADRIEFSHQYWLSKFLFDKEGDQHLADRLDKFFFNLEDIGVYLTQGAKGSPFQAHMVYSLQGDQGFFHGNPPASEETLATLVKRFGHIEFPRDYLAFLTIHDGFNKYLDTGLIRTRDMAKVYQKLQLQLEDRVLLGPDKEEIDSAKLIPFYESIHLHSYQCFFTDWQANDEMYNLYFSPDDYASAHLLDPRLVEENFSFTSFLGWLLFYLEDIWLLNDS
jgi:hypothetical protein